MKKTVAVIALLISVTVFFCGNVFAATSTANTGYFKEASYTSSGVTVNIAAQELLPYDGSFTMTTGNPAFSSWNMVVTVSIKNTTTSYKYIAGININIQLDNPSLTSPVNFVGITDIENFTDELLINKVTDQNAGLQLQASSDFAYDDGFIVPPNTTIRAVAVLTFPVELSGTTFYRARLNNVTFGWSTVNNTDVVKSGNISDILSVLNSLNSYLQTNISGIRGDLYVISSNLGDVVVAEENIYSYLTGTTGIPGIRADLYVISSNTSDIKNYLTGDSTTNNNVSSDSGTLKTQSDTVHNQEVQFFNQNAQAISNSGLQNYTFSSDMSGGVGAVALDWTKVYNSLGSFTSVYIFSLTLGLALTILRHAPSAISRKMRNKSDD